MPLPGGPSDKAGNRYEIRWVVRQLIDLVTGRLDWLRLEPPGDDAIELRCATKDAEYAHQVKRGISGGGHWTLAALGDVLDGFGRLLRSEAKLNCLFVSQDAAADLRELGERARSSRDFKEFAKRFLNARNVSDSWSALCRRWAASEPETWRRLRRISAETIGEDLLRDSTETSLQLIFDARPEITRALLTELALESIHRELRAEDVLRHLARHGIHRHRTSRANGISPAVSPPPATGVRRDEELARIGELFASGKTTVLLGGISGIGKSTVAAQYAAERGGAICWLDCALFSSGVEALATLGEFVMQRFEDDSVTKMMPKAESQVAAVGRLVGKVLARHGCLIVWDGVDGDRVPQLRPAIDALAATLSGAAMQLVTAQEVRESGKVVTIGTMQVGRLDRSTVAHLLTDAYPQARTAEIEAADDITHGHPYLVQLLVDAASVLDLTTALRDLGGRGRSAPLVDALVSKLTAEARTILTTLAWLEIPFRALHVERLGGSIATLRDLAERHLIVRAGSNAYRVHDLVGHLLKATSTDAERADFHERAALLLHGIDAPSWLEVRAMLRHSRAASLVELTREAGSLLLAYAMDSGFWGLAREAAVSLTRDSSEYFPHFVLAKSYRMTEEFSKALAHYEAAEGSATTSQERNIARYDRASVLFELNRYDEANEIYRAMLESPEPGMRSASRLALALSTTDRDVAMALLEEALAIATEADDRRTIADIHHAMARTFINEEAWEAARTHLKTAHTLRMELTGPEAFDVLGWFQMLKSIVRVERALGNHAGARSATHSLCHFALASGSVRWETGAANVMCLADPDPKEPDVIGAMSRLYTLREDVGLEVPLRILVLESLVICEWSLKHYEEATEAILELLALANEQHVKIPYFAYAVPTGNTSPKETVTPAPMGYALFVPLGERPEFVYDLVSRVLARRPELTQHAKMFLAEPRSKQSTPRQPKPRKKTR